MSLAGLSLETATNRTYTAWDVRRRRGRGVGTGMEMKQSTYCAAFGHRGHPLADTLQLRDESRCPCRINLHVCLAHDE